MRNKILAAAMAAATALAGNSVTAGKTNESQYIKVLSPKEFMEEAKENPEAEMIDVRTPQEYSQGHLPGATNINWLDEKSFDAEVSKLPKNKTYLLYCRSGHRSHEAAVKMQSEGYKVAEMNGGILNYEAQGLPLATLT